MTTCSVYWIRAKDHSNMALEGYVGVSKNANKRWKYGHFWAQKNGRHDNPHFANAIEKHGWDNLIKEILVIASQEYCYELEAKLRPAESIGWNLAIGGHKPPASKSRGPDYVSPLKGVPRPTPWLVGKSKPPSIEACIAGGKKAKGRKQTPEQIAKRVASRRATLTAQGRTH
jgi:hypothetical protein